MQYMYTYFFIVDAIEVHQEHYCYLRHPNNTLKKAAANMVVLSHAHTHTHTHLTLNLEAAHVANQYDSMQCFR